jgi:hypothetical protein
MFICFVWGLKMDAFPVYHMNDNLFARKTLPRIFYQYKLITSGEKNGEQSVEMQRLHRH